MKNIFTFFIFSFFISFLSAQTYTLDSTILTSRVVKTGLDIPWEIIWGPDDHIWTTERYGRVSRIDPNTGDQDILLDLTSVVWQQGESGMLGMVLQPDFENSPHVFIAYTYRVSGVIYERVVKFNYDGTQLTPMDTLLNDLKGWQTHNGARFVILPDNTLIMSTGDAQDQNLPQDATSLSGKILRMNLDGTIPSDNPYANSYVYSIGHRNAQGLCLAPNGILYSSEHGPSTDDELNIIEPKRNYGWPDVTGFCNTAFEIPFCNTYNVFEPLAAWTPTIAPSDIVWYEHNAIPEFKNKLLMTVLKDKKLVSFGFDALGTTVETENSFLVNEFGRLRDICVSPNGAIYLATNGDSWSNTSPFTHSIIELKNENFVSSVEENSINSEVFVGPNPIDVGQKLQINLSEKGTLSLFNSKGQVVLNQTVTPTSNVPLNISKGLYIWRITTANNKNHVGKLVVK